MDKRELSERDICTKFITPAIERAGWKQSQFREEVKLTDGRVMVRGNLASRVRNPDAKGGPKRADYVIYARPNVPVAVVEAKHNRFAVGHGMQQALVYAEMLDAPFALSSNGDGFLLHDRTGLTQPVERELGIDEFPKISDLWPVYRKWKGLEQENSVKLVEQPYHSDGSGKAPLPADRNGCCWLWQPEQVRPTQRFKSSGVCGRRKEKNGFFFLQTAIFLLTKPCTRIFRPLVKSCTKSPTGKSKKIMKYTSPCIRPLPAMKSGSRFIGNFRRIFLIWW